MVSPLPERLCELPGTLCPSSCFPATAILCGCGVAKFQALPKEERVGRLEFQLTCLVPRLKLLFSGPHR